ncbi:hypothetical protein [Nostoc sp. PCC 7524]|uniref:hypothetical protein n=1 Tax=Nostoc sp. (strain ATCC 29411 / PCC 7524) TaxID=28072 RepID=UPI000AF30DB3|nr:hypothetical protein [Nostoc sp. PCC 7524]
MYSNNSKQISFNKPEVTTTSYVKFVLMRQVVKTVMNEATLIEKMARLSNCLAIS